VGARCFCRGGHGKNLGRGFGWGFYPTTHQTPRGPSGFRGGGGGGGGGGRPPTPGDFLNRGGGRLKNSLILPPPGEQGFSKPPGRINTFPKGGNHPQTTPAKSPRKAKTPPGYVTFSRGGGGAGGKACEGGGGGQKGELGNLGKLTQMFWAKKKPRGFFLGRHGQFYYWAPTATGLGFSVAGGGERFGCSRGPQPVGARGGRGGGGAEGGWGPRADKSPPPTLIPGKRGGPTQTTGFFGGFCGGQPVLPGGSAFHVCRGGKRGGPFLRWGRFSPGHPAGGFGKPLTLLGFVLYGGVRGRDFVLFRPKLHFEWVLNGCYFFYPKAGKPGPFVGWTDQTRLFRKPWGGPRGAWGGHFWPGVPGDLRENPRPARGGGQGGPDQKKTWGLARRIQKPGGRGGGAGHSF